MSNRKLSRPFTVSRFTFTPAPTGSVKVHRLRLPLRFTGKDPAAVLDYAARVRGEDLHVTLELADGADAVEVVARIESASVKLSKGSKKPPVVIAVVVESEDVTPIAAVLDGAMRAARVQALELEVTFQLIQENLPGMDEEPERASSEDLVRELQDMGATVATGAGANTLSIPLGKKRGWRAAKSSSPTAGD